MQKIAHSIVKNVEIDITGFLVSKNTQKCQLKPLAQATSCFKYVNQE